MGRFHVLAQETYDPKALGAQCDVCVLKGAKGGPVPPEYHDKSTAAIITDYPREKELETRRPLSGSHGIMLNETLQSVGIRRTRLDLHQSIACMPPEGDLDKVMLKWTRENKRRKKMGFEPVPSPMECCRPRLLMELEHQNLVTLGKTAYHAVTGKARPINDIRGGPVDGGFDAAGNFLVASDPSLYHTPLKVLPTLHPGFVQQSKRWTKAFKSDLSRAFRWFSGHLGWKEPRITLNPAPDQLALFLSRPDVAYSFDVETTFEDPIIGKLKCVGISDEDHAMVVHLLSIEGPGGSLVGGPYTESDELEIRGIMRDFFADPTRLKVGHNAGYFDRMVIKTHFGVDPQPLLDTILLHRSVESELPHKLGYVGSVYTDVTAWKEAHTASEAQSDRELGVYCGIDCTVVARALPQLYEAAQLRQQLQVVQFDHQIQEVCVGLHEAGMFVDQKQRDIEAARLIEEMKVHGEAARLASGQRDMNLNSTFQLRDLLYAHWLLSPVAYTKLGDPSTNDESLRLLRTANKANERVCNFIDSLRKYRRASKEYGTYVKRMVSYDTIIGSADSREDDGEDDGENIPDQTQQSVAVGKKKRGLILWDGRVHPDYNAHGTTSGRLSSSSPNAQNWPKHLRGMIIPQPGHVLVGADADQLELRSIASVAGIGRYLDIFEKGGDPHAETASMMFRKAFDDLVPKSDQWDKLRKIAKSIKYASFYGSGDETVHNLVTSAEDDQGRLMYPDLSVREVATLRRNWLKGIPELPRWWDDVLEEYRSAGFIADPVLGRRRDFLDGEEFNEIVNFPIQCVPGWTRILTSEGYIPIDQLRGRKFIAWTGKKWATAQVIDRGMAELHRVRTQRGMDFVCDDRHEGLCVGREGYEWRSLVGAGQHTRFALDRARELHFGLTMDPSDAYVAGYWTGDGSSTIVGSDSFIVSFVIAEGEGPRAGEEMQKKLTDWASNRGITFTLDRNPGCFSVRFHRGADLWLKSIGADLAWKAHTKKIPELIWRSDLEARKQFMRGLLDADGYLHPDGAVILNLCQKQLLQEVAVLCRTVGIEGSILGPVKADKKGHTSFRLLLNGAQTFTSLGWGRECKLRTSAVSTAPRFESKRVQSKLKPQSQADKVIKSRIKTNGNPAVSPYVLARMGVDDVYDHDAVISVKAKTIHVPVYTLAVADDEHRYVAEGVISRNCGSAHVIHLATFDLLKVMPFGKWGPGTGLIAQVHDALYAEVPCHHGQFQVPNGPNGKPDEKLREFGWCPPGCRCEANWAARQIEEAMNRTHPGFPGVTFSATAKIATRWSKV